MPRYVAFLRGVSPLNAKMPELRRCFEEAGFANVTTVLSSGNVVFDARSALEASLERRAESQMQDFLGRSLYTVVRQADALRSLQETDLYAAFALPANAKRVVSFRVSQSAPNLCFRLNPTELASCAWLAERYSLPTCPARRGPCL